MAEIWVAAAATVVGGVMAGKAAEKKDKGDKSHAAAMSKDESKYTAQRLGHEKALEDFYSQKERSRRQRGLAQFKQFSTMGEVAPSYDQSAEPQIGEPVMPNYNDFDPDKDNPAPNPGVNGKKKKNSLLDPLGLF